MSVDSAVLHLTVHPNTRHVLAGSVVRTPERTGSPCCRQAPRPRRRSVVVAASSSLRFHFAPPTPASRTTRLLDLESTIRDPEPSHSGRPEARLAADQDPGARGLLPEEGRLQQSLHRQAQEAQFGSPQGRQGQTQYRQGHHRLHPRRGSQLAGALGRARPRRTDTGSPRRKVSGSTSTLLCVDWGLTRSRGPTRARYKIVRGALDLNGVAGRAVSRSKYGSECRPLALPADISATCLADTFESLQPRSRRSSAALVSSRFPSCIIIPSQTMFCGLPLGLRLPILMHVRPPACPKETSRHRQSARPVSCEIAASRSLAVLSCSPNLG